MRKHLFTNSVSLLDLDNPFIEIGHWEYIKKRVQFWKYRKHRTLGRPVLMLWRKSNRGENGL